MLRSLLIERFKNAYGVQYLVIMFSVLCCVIYSLAMFTDLSSFAYSIVKNTSTFQSDKDLVRVSSYTVNSDGTISFSTEDDKAYDSKQVSFLFIDDDSVEGTYYSEEGNCLLSNLSSDYWLNFLIGTKYFIMLVFTILMLVLAYLLQHKDYLVLSDRWVIYVYFSLFVIVLTVGVVAVVYLA